MTPETAKKAAELSRKGFPFTVAVSLEHMLTLLSTATAVTQQLVKRVATKGKKEKQSASECRPAPDTTS